MKLIENIANYLQKTTKKEFEKLLLIISISLAFVSLSGIYYIHSKSSGLVAQIKKLEKLVNNSNFILSENKKIQAEEKRLMELLEKNKDFNIKSFFEQFCQQQGLTAQLGWDTRTIPIEGNEKFDEIILPAIFKGQTTASLVNVIETLDKNEIVYIKELTIRKGGISKINYQITLATKKYKRFLEEGF